jgi:hypothetical protein
VEKTVIQSWIVANYPQNIGESFSLGIPTSLIGRILHGINIFGDHKKRELDSSIGIELNDGKQSEEQNQ